MSDLHRKSTRKKAHSTRSTKSGNSGKNGKQRDIVERTSRTTERFHRAVAGLPLDLLERLDGLSGPIARVRKLQERSIAARYEMFRGVNREVAELLRDARAGDALKRRKTRAVPHVKSTDSHRGAAATG